MKSDYGVRRSASSEDAAEYRAEGDSTRRNIASPIPPRAAGGRRGRVLFIKSRRGSIVAGHMVGSISTRTALVRAPVRNGPPSAFPSSSRSGAWPKLSTLPPRPWQRGGFFSGAAPNCRAPTPPRLSGSRVPGDRSWTITAVHSRPTVIVRATTRQGIYVIARYRARAASV